SRDRFREAELRVLQTVCDQIGAMLERAHLTRELREREGALRVADLRKDNFIATLAHELRNPLAPIRNAITIMNRMPMADKQLAWCRDVIDRQIQQMTILLEDLLDVSRVTRNKLELRRRRASVVELVEQAIETTRPLIEQQRHQIVLCKPDHP